MVDSNQDEYEFHPFSIGVTKDDFPMKAGWPFPRGIKISHSHLEITVFGETTLIDRSEIDSIERGFGYIRVRWPEGSAIINSIRGMEVISRAFEATGYRFIA